MVFALDGDSTTTRAFGIFLTLLYSSAGAQASQLTLPPSASADSLAGFSVVHEPTRPTTESLPRYRQYYRQSLLQR